MNLYLRVICSTITNPINYIHRSYKRRSSLELSAKIGGVVAWSTPFLWSSVVVCFSDQRDTYYSGWEDGLLDPANFLFCPYFYRLHAKVVFGNQSRVHFFRRDNQLVFCLLISLFQSTFLSRGSHAPIFEFLSGRSKIGLVTYRRLQKVHLLVQLTILLWSNVTYIYMESMLLDYLKIFRSTPLLVHAKVTHTYFY